MKNVTKKIVVLTCCSVLVIKATEQQPQAPVDTQQVSTLSWDPAKEGITSVEGDERGNWWEKAKVLEKAQQLYAKIRELVTRVEGHKKQFFDKRNALDQELDLFYTEAGFDQGTLEEQFNELLKQFDALKDKEGLLDEQEKALFADVEAKKKDLEQLKKDLTSLHEIDNSVDKALDKMIDQLDLCSVYREKAWDRYEKIAEILSDTTAKLMYAEMESYFDHIQALEKYFTQELPVYFDQSIQNAQQQMQTIKSMIANLKERGVELAKKSNELQSAAQQIVEVQPEEKPVIQQSWYTRWWNGITEWLYGWYAWIVGK